MSFCALLYVKSCESFNLRLFMNIFGIGLPEMILIMLVALLIFGPKKLPEIGRSMGKAIKGFQDASREFESEFKRESDRLEQEPAIAQTASSSADDLATPVATAVEVLTVPDTKELSKIADA